MKHFSKLPFLLAVTALAIMAISFAKKQNSQQPLQGAWSLQSGDTEQVLLLADGYLTLTTYKGKGFLHTEGGPFSYAGGQLSLQSEFNTTSKDLIGGKETITLAVDGSNLVWTRNGQQQTWKKIDDGTAPLAGVWRITQRMENGQLTPIHQTGARKTLKILTGTRFQWAAINPETKEFSGTGGGTYTFAGGKYTENIGFFSRDSTRVGASLTFDDKLENGQWHHTGLSSRGDKIYEVWSRVQ